MNFSSDIGTAATRRTALIAIGSELKALAAGLDAHFASAGATLARAHDVVEHLIGSLEPISGAMGDQAGGSAVDSLRLTADSLTHLPMEQGQRQQGLTIISAASADLLQNLKQIRRTLSFLHICGLNIKVTAAGAAGFADFADHMFAKLQQAELQVDEFEDEITLMESGIRDMVESDRRLISECITVIPRVPLKLAQGALALQKWQDDSAALAGRTAILAHDMRSKLAAALAAIQIGDKTRQRLEHITQAVDLVAASIASSDLAGDAGAGDHDAAHGHMACPMQAVDGMIGLITAQARDSYDEFLRETETLYASLRGLVPDAARLVEIQQGSSRRDTPKLMAELEIDVADIAKVTHQLCAAAANSSQLGQATSQAAESLRSRLKAVNRIQRDVEQMAWNTALQCRDLGADGRGIAVISEEIQSFSRHLADIWERVAHNFAQVESAADTVGQQCRQAAEPDADLDRVTGSPVGTETGASAILLESLDMIRAGSAQMDESLRLVDQDAVQISHMLGTLAQDIAADAPLETVMMKAVDRLSLMAEAGIAQQPMSAASSTQDRQFVSQLAAQIYDLYTMPTERDVHRAFVAGRRDVDMGAGAA